MSRVLRMGGQSVGHTLRLRRRSSGAMSPDPSERKSAMFHWATTRVLLDVADRLGPPAELAGSTGSRDDDPPKIDRLQDRGSDER